MKYFIVFACCLFVLVVGFLYAVLAMPGRSSSGSLPALTEQERAVHRNLAIHIHRLAGEIGERNFAQPDHLVQAARYIETRFELTGYEVESHHFGGENQAFINLAAELPGSDSEDGVILVGAHYDTVRGSPGADDNASGVAGLLEIARLLKAKPLRKTVRFVAFTNEEEPFTHSSLMGSVVHAKHAREKSEPIEAMLSLESLGFYSDATGSQHYPPPLSWFYPDTGSFIAFIGNLKSRSLVRHSIASFRRHSLFPSEGIAAPESLFEDIRRSDHASFWANGFPALMVTDTVPFRNPHYHRASDTPDTISFDHLTRVVIGLSKVVEDLANTH